MNRHTLLGLLRLALIVIVAWTCYNLLRLYDIFTTPLLPPLTDVAVPGDLEIDGPVYFDGPVHVLETNDLIRFYVTPPNPDMSSEP